MRKLEKRLGLRRKSDELSTLDKCQLKFTNAKSKCMIVRVKGENEEQDHAHVVVSHVTSWLSPRYLTTCRRMVMRRVLHLDWPQVQVGHQE